jgi:hypothetical protein
MLKPATHTSTCDPRRIVICPSPYCLPNPPHYRLRAQIHRKEQYVVGTVGNPLLQRERSLAADPLQCYRPATRRQRASAAAAVLRCRICRLAWLDLARLLPMYYSLHRFGPNDDGAKRTERYNGRCLAAGAPAWRSGQLR